MARMKEFYKAEVAPVLMKKFSYKSVMETRPLSKDKRWRLVEIIEKAK